MGTERSEYFRRTCLCGQGELVIEFCMPDHPWAQAGRGTWGLSIHCDSCKKEYVLEERNNQAVIVRKFDVQARSQLGHECYERARKIMESDQVQQHLHDFETLISSQPTVTATYNLFRSTQILSSSINTFRRDLKREGATGLLRRHVNLRNMPHILNKLGKKDESLLTTIAELEALKTQAQEPCEIIGEPICDITEEAFYKK